MTTEINLDAHRKILKDHLSLYPELIKLCMLRMQNRKTKADPKDYLKKTIEHIYDAINYIAMEIQREPGKKKMLGARLPYLAEAIRSL